MIWTGGQLADEARAWLAALPLVATVGDATLAHGSPHEPEEWDYLLTPDDGFAVFTAFETRLCLIGHSHRPAVWSVGGRGPDHEADFEAWPVEVSLRPGRRYLVNVGSVGQPRDRDPRAAYAVWQDGKIHLKRVEYPIDKVVETIEASDLPEPAKRLSIDVFRTGTSGNGQPAAQVPGGAP